MTHYEVTGEKGIRALGLKYEPEMKKCQRHMFNDVVVEMDLGRNFDSYENIEKNLERVFAKLIADMLKTNKEVLRVHKIEWDRVFFFPFLYTARRFDAAHWVKVYSVDRTLGDNHVQGC